MLGWRDVPTDDAAHRPDRARRDAAVPPGVPRRRRTAQTGLELERLAFARAGSPSGAPARTSSSCTSRRCRRARSSTRACSRPTSSASSSPTCADERFASAIGLVHSRFSTNTFPSWPLAHPFRYIAHNGEFNTIRGNRNWMRTRETLLESDLIPGDLRRLFPICTPDASDSATFDEVLELLHLGGRSLPHAVLMMIPEAWENNAAMDPDAARVLPVPRLADGGLGRPGLRQLHRRHGHRRRARPQRAASRPVVADRRTAWSCWAASPACSTSTRPTSSPRAGCSRAGCSSSTPSAARSARTRTSRPNWPTEHPYDEWLHAGLIRLEDLPAREHVVFSHESVTRRQQIFGYTEEELRILLAPMATGGIEPLGSMGTDTPLAVLSKRPRLLFDYFTELFAQVTNPPLDAIREEMVTSLAGAIGPEQNLLTPGPASCRQIVHAAAGDRQRRAGQDLARQRRRRPARLPVRADRRPLPRVRRRRGAGRGDRAGAARVLAGDRGRRAHPDPVRPRLRRRPRADPGAAADLGRAPAPGAHRAAHPGRAGRRDRRGPRGAPRRAADRLRRGGGQPVPRVRVDRGSRQLRRDPRRHRREGASRTTSRR